MRIVAIEEKNGTGQKGVRNVKLFSKNILLRAELLNMRDADVRHNGILRPGNLSKTAHFPEVTHSHLDDCHLVLRLKTEHRQRKTNLTVLIAFRLHGIPACGQGEGHHLLRRRLADASGDANHRNIEAGTVSGGNAAQSLHRIRHGNPDMIVLHL